MYGDRHSCSGHSWMVIYQFLWLDYFVYLWKGGSIFWNFKGFKLPLHIQEAPTLSSLLETWKEFQLLKYALLLSKYKIPLMWFSNHIVLSYPYQVEKNFLNGKLKAITAYFNSTAVREQWMNQLSSRGVEREHI